MKRPIKGKNKVFNHNVCRRCEKRFRMRGENTKYCPKCVSEMRKYERNFEAGYLNNFSRKEIVEMKKKQSIGGGNTRDFERYASRYLSVTNYKICDSCNKHFFTHIASQTNCDDCFKDSKPYLSVIAKTSDIIRPSNSDRMVFGNTLVKDFVPDELICIRCESRNIKKYGFRFNRYYSQQRYACKTCRKTFSIKMFWRHSIPDSVIIEMQMERGSLRKIAHRLTEKYGVNINHWYVHRVRKLEFPQTSLSQPSAPNDAVKTNEFSRNGKSSTFPTAKKGE